MYQQYETLALRYLPEVKLRADISGLGFHIADTHLEAMVYILHIYPAITHESIVNTTGGQILMKSVLYWEVMKVYNMIILKLHFKTI